jgi:hypothetical protein
MLLFAYTFMLIPFGNEYLNYAYTFWQQVSLAFKFKFCYLCSALSSHAGERKLDPMITSKNKVSLQVPMVPRCIQCIDGASWRSMDWILNTELVLFCM